MSSSRHHIPFPRNFLSLNTPTKKANDAGFVTRSPESEVPPHTFLSNRTHPVPRHSSMSSVSSDESTIASPQPLPNDGEHSHGLKPALMAFLRLNTKHVAAPRPAEDGVKSPFLSNKG